MGSTLRVRLLIDQDGRPVRDSVAFSHGSTDPHYLRDLRDALALDVYAPAILDGCAVPGHAYRTISYGSGPAAHPTPPRAFGSSP